MFPEMKPHAWDSLTTLAVMLPLHEFMSMIVPSARPWQSPGPLQDPGQIVASPSQPVHAVAALQQVPAQSNETCASFPVKHGQHLLGATDSGARSKQVRSQ